MTKYIPNWEASEYYVTPTIIVDEIIHTDDEPYCGDGTCGCVDQAVEDGILTKQEAARLATGRNI